MKALVLSSGGVDSTTALGLAVKKYGKENVIALSVSYGQKHTKEIEAAKAQQSQGSIKVHGPDGHFLLQDDLAYIQVENQQQHKIAGENQPRDNSGDRVLS